MMAGTVQTQKLALKDLKGDADQTLKHAEVHGLFVVQRMRSDSGLNTVEQMPSEYMWDMVESFEKRLQEYGQASAAPVFHTDDVLVRHACVTHGSTECGDMVVVGGVFMAQINVQPHPDGLVGPR